ncbi:Alpha/Beta hydrolase protein [Mariannaea sp. PMI_226]|nr:Alpha/Beta hydrolase protein [Mariannaea sp. PMI_226]
MASHPPGKCCTEGFRHEGEPRGKLIKIANDSIDAYLATPPDGVVDKKVGILYIADIFGIWNNSKLLADEFAKNGFTCLIPDLFNGDHFPQPRPPNFDLMGWFAKGTNGDNPHSPEYVDPITVKGIEALKGLGLSKIGAVGYCFGAKYLIRNYKSGIQVGFVAHPSFVTEEEFGAITGPLSIAAAQVDSIFPVEKRIASEKILGGLDIPWQINLYSGTEHGFAVRADLTKRQVAFAKEQAFGQAVRWFDEHLVN